jgi:hypothetical protein
MQPALDAAHDRVLSGVHRLINDEKARNGYV